MCDSWGGFTHRPAPIAAENEPERAGFEFTEVQPLSITSSKTSELQAVDELAAVSAGEVSKVGLRRKPLVSIRPSRGWVALHPRDLWSYRGLLYFLTWRDVKVRYKQTVLGAAWAIIQPLFTMLIFTVFFGRIAGFPSEGVPYALFAYAGLLPWTFFSNSVTASGNSLVGNANLITKVYFPRMIIPAAAVAAGLVDLAIASVFFLALMAYYGVGITWMLMALPILVALLTLLTLAVGMWFSAVNVKYRDVRYAIPFLVQLGMFVSPVIYPLSMIPAKWRWVLLLNPLAGIIEGFRSCLLGRPFDWRGLFVSAALTLLLLVYSAYAFRRMERSFADVI